MLRNLVSVKEFDGEDHDHHHNATITCDMCYLVEVGESKRAKMGRSIKKYDRNCLNPWAQHEVNLQHACNSGWEFRIIKTMTFFYWFSPLWSKKQSCALAKSS